MNFYKKNITSYKVSKILGRYKAFTLVELIIVITILIILATIAFISFGGYTINTRDTNRITTLSNMGKGLDIFYTQTNIYPNPDEFIEIIGTGGTIIKQGVIGETNTKQIKSNTTPRDPLSKNNYTYSILHNNRDYQLATVLENTIGYNNSIIPKTYANSQYEAYVSGSYKPKILEVGGYLYFIPSLILADIEYLGEVEGKKRLPNNPLSQYFVLNKEKNLPYNLNLQNNQTTNTSSNELSVVKELLTNLIENGSEEETTKEQINNLLSGAEKENLDDNFKELVLKIEKVLEGGIKEEEPNEINLTIKSIQNVSTDKYYPNNNNNGWPLMIQGTSNNWTYRNYFLFEDFNIPLGYSIKSANFIFTPTDDSNSDNWSFQEIKPVRISSNWDPDTITWNNSPNIVDGYNDYKSLPHINEEVSIDVTNLVSDWNLGETNYGIALYSRYEGSEWRYVFRIVSIFHLSDNRIPYLDITLQKKLINFYNNRIYTTSNTGRDSAKSIRWIKN